MSKKLTNKEDLDFAYLLELMPPLHDVPGFCWLPELYSLVGHEGLLKLCKYAGGERIQIPTLDQLTDSMYALQWFYDVHISKKRDVTEVPLKVLPMFMKVVNVYNERQQRCSKQFEKK